MLHLLNSSVTHEMVTPLKCIVSFAKSILKELEHSPKRHEAELIISTTKLILSQVKLLLDKNMIEHDLFEPELTLSPLNKTVSSVIEILEKQADLQQIEI